MSKEGLLGVQNGTELDAREREIRTATNNRSGGSFALADDFPMVHLALSRTEFAPDYLEIGIRSFCSSRLRDVLALPPDVVQFLPTEVIAGSEEARSHDYRMMHVLAEQPAIDLKRSGCVMEEITHAVTGETIPLIASMKRLVLLKGLQPRSDLFSIAEATHLTLVTDALAARVLQSGCTEVEFRDPANPLFHVGCRIERYRTTTGIAERRVGFLD